MINNYVDNNMYFIKTSTHDHNVCQFESNNRKGILSEFIYFSNARFGISENAIYLMQIQATFRWFYATDQCSNVEWSVAKSLVGCFVGRMYLFGQG